MILDLLDFVIRILKIRYMVLINLSLKYYKYVLESSKNMKIYAEKRMN